MREIVECTKIINCTYKSTNMASFSLILHRCKCKIQKYYTMSEQQKYIYIFIYCIEHNLAVTMLIITSWLFINDYLCYKRKGKKHTKYSPYWIKAKTKKVTDCTWEYTNKHTWIISNKYFALINSKDMKVNKNSLASNLQKPATPQFRNRNLPKATFIQQLFKLKDKQVV